MKGDATHGLAILSAFPIENARMMELPAGLSKRIALAADIRIGARTLHVVDVHLDTVLNVTDRILQLRPAVLDAPDAVLVAGDVNTNDYLWADGVPHLPADVVADADQAPILDDYMRALGFDTPTALLGPTEHKYLSEFRLDAIFTRGLRVTPGRVVREVDESDHWPMYVDVDLP
jgi:endonuclease/exonuclease/phosphatase family metal-dependent hydrolase